MGKRQEPGASGTSSLADALFPQTKRKVVALLFGQPDRAFGTSELITLVGAGSGAVQREVERLARVGLISATIEGRQKRYQANPGSPIFEELRAIVGKTAGVPDTLRRALAPIAPKLQLAILYGSVAKETDRATSDIDVLLVGDDLTLEEVLVALEPAERQLGRRISPTLYTSDELERRRRAGQSFITKVLGGTHVVLVGHQRGTSAAR